MTPGKVDVIILGATGFTGRCVVQEFIHLNKNGLTWAVAGRDSNKLKDVLSWASLRTGQDVTSISVIDTHCDDQESLNAMANRGNVVINCIGPYRKYGEAVVKACIGNGTHHIDVSGEPEYMESMQLNYNATAESKGVYVISACGFDSIPADFGVLHMIKNFPGVVNSVESYMASYNKSLECAANIGTWESIVLSISNGTKKLKAIRSKILAPLNALRLEPKLKSRPLIHRSELFNNQLSLPFPGSDKAVVMRTQQFLYEQKQQRPVQYRPYFICNVPVLFGLTIVAIFLAALSRFSLGRMLLMKYPEFFSLGIMSRKGPSEESRVRTLVKFKFKGLGWSHDLANKFDNHVQINAPTNKSMITEISIADFAYGFTARAAILCAITIVNEYSQMPKKGGVLSPGAAFENTSFMEKLPITGLTFKVMTKE